MLPFIVDDPQDLRLHPLALAGRDPDRPRAVRAARQTLDRSFANVRQGYGTCSKCNCRGYEGSSSTCANSGCGHAYGDHW